jgi:hypothetical protein
MNEVAAVTQRLMDGLLLEGEISPSIAIAFETKRALEHARTMLRKGSNVHLALGHITIRRYLGQGDLARSGRGERDIREAMANLKLDSRYDDMVEQALLENPPPVEPAKTKTEATPPAKKEPKGKFPLRSPQPSKLVAAINAGLEQGRFSPISGSKPLSAPVPGNVT